MDVDLFSGMPDPAGALLPGALALGIVMSGRARSSLGGADRLWLIALSLALSFALARVSITPEETALYIPPGATLLVCYLVWCGHIISPGLAFVVTYATLLPADYILARTLLGAEFDPACIGGAGWCDGLLVLPTLTALAVVYANWRMGRVGRSRLAWVKLAPPLAIFQGMEDWPRGREAGYGNVHRFAIPSVGWPARDDRGGAASGGLRRGR